MSLRRRGIVLAPDDLAGTAWPELAGRAGLNTIALHPFPEPVLAFVESEAGPPFLQACADLGLEVEYELHAMRYLLPRELFAQQPELFRVNEAGERAPDANLCPSSPAALRLVGERAVALSRVLRPTTSRYFLWADDGAPWCCCPRCAPLSPSDQNLLVMNHLVGALRADDPDATLAVLCYANTLEPPREVRPAPGLFMEFAPIEQDPSRPLTDPESAPNRRLVEQFEALAACFGTDEAQVLGYWLDCSRFSGWKRPSVEVPYADAVLRSDLAYYTAHGVRSVTTFGVWLDADYLARFGVPPVAEYGRALQEAR